MKIRFNRMDLAEKKGWRVIRVQGSPRKWWKLFVCDARPEDCDVCHFRFQCFTTREGVEIVNEELWRLLDKLDTRHKIKRIKAYIKGKRTYKGETWRKKR